MAGINISKLLKYGKTITVGTRINVDKSKPTGRPIFRRMLGINKHKANDAILSNDNAVPIKESENSKSVKWTGTNTANIPIDVAASKVLNTLTISPTSACLPEPELSEPESSVLASSGAYVCTFSCIIDPIRYKTQLKVGCH